MSEVADLYRYPEEIIEATRRHPAASRKMLVFGLIAGTGDADSVTDVRQTEDTDPLIGASEVIEFPQSHTSAAVITFAERATAEQPASDSYNPLKDEIRPEYPNISFRFNRNWIVGTGIVEATPDSRLRAVLTALHDQADQKLGKVSDVKESYRRLLQLLGQQVKLPDGQRIPKSDILPEERAIDDAFDILTRRNHPVAQAISQLQAKYPDLPKSHIRDIRAQLTATTSIAAIRETYKQAIAEAQSASPQTEQPHAS